MHIKFIYVYLKYSPCIQIFMILVSACLAGEPVRYDGKSCRISILDTPILNAKVKTICPELLGGFTTPRLAAEIKNGTGLDVLCGKAKVIDAAGTDVTEMYIAGAQKTLKIAQQLQARCIVLKQNSPSCANQFIYDGSFTNKKIHGNGVTSALLKQHGFEVICEDELEDWLQENELI